MLFDQIYIKLLKTIGKDSKFIINYKYILYSLSIGNSYICIYKTKS